MIMDGVSRDCQTAWNRRFSAGSIGTPVFDSRLSQKVCNTHVEARLAGPGRYASLDVQNPNLQRATRTQPDSYLHCGIGPPGLPRAHLFTRWACVPARRTNHPSSLETSSLSAASSGIPASCMAEKKVDWMSHALHLRGVMAIVTSSVCSSNGPTVARVTWVRKEL